MWTLFVLTLIKSVNFLAIIPPMTYLVLLRPGWIRLFRMKSFGSPFIKLLGKIVMLMAEEYSLFVREHLRCEVLATTGTELKGKPKLPEFVFCSINDCKNPPVLVAVIYRPPEIAFLKNSNLVNTLWAVLGDYSHKIIMGDLNADLQRGRHDVKFARNLPPKLSL